MVSVCVCAKYDKYILYFITVKSVSNSFSQDHDLLCETFLFDFSHRSVHKGCSGLCVL